MYKEVKVLEEKLEKVTQLEFNRLSQQISSDDELRRMLITPMEEIPQYRYLYSSGLRHLGQHSLFDALQFMFEYEHRANFYFSKIGNKFTGFIVYQDNGKIINSIKMASFKDDKTQTNPILAKDIIEFILDMASQRDTIEWYVDSENKKAIQQYNALLTRKGLNWKSGKDGKMIKYVVQRYADTQK